MSARIQVDCPECGARLTLKSREKLGKRVRCPRCETGFVAKLRGDDVLEDDLWLDDAGDDEFDEEDALPSRQRRRGALPERGRGRPAGGAAGPRRRTPAAGSERSWVVPVSIGGAAVATILLCVVVVVIRVGNRDRNEEKRLAEKRRQLNESARQARTFQPAQSTAGQALPDGGGPGPTGFPYSPPGGEPVSDDEARTFAEDLTRAVASNDTNAFDRLYDYRAMIESAMSGMDVDPMEKRGVIDGASRHAVLRELSIAISSGSALDAVRIHEKDGRNRALLRLIRPHGGVSYYDFVIAKDSRGSVRTVDFYDFGKGELYSQSMRQLYQQLFGGAQGTTGQSNSAQRELTQVEPMMKQILALYRSGQAREALALIHRLPPVVRDSKPFILMRINIAHGVGLQEYVDAMEAFREQLPGDVAFEFLAIHYYVLTGEPEKSLEAVNRLDKVVGGDVALNLVRADVKMAQGEFQPARQLLDETIAQNVAVEHAQWMLIDVALAEQNYDEVVQRLSQIEQQFGMRRPNFAAEPEFAAFVASPQYRQWQQSRPR